jgi:hypothetical protein
MTPLTNPGNAHLLNADTDGSKYPSMKLDELRGFIAQNPWTYAKTMPWCPHEWVHRKNVKDDATFLSFVMTIRRYGCDENFGNYVHRYLDVDECKYWTMGNWIVTTIIINRARINHAPRPMALNPKVFIPVVNTTFPAFVPQTRPSA